MAKWINIKDIAGSAKFYAGVAIRIMPTRCGLAEGNFIPENGLVYLISDNASDKSYFNCVCLSAGKEGNVICHPWQEGSCVLEIELQEAFVSASVAISVM